MRVRVCAHWHGSQYYQGFGYRGLLCRTSHRNFFSVVSRFFGRRKRQERKWVDVIGDLDTEDYRVACSISAFHEEELQSILNMVSSVVRETHWPPDIIGGFFIDNQDQYGLRFWYEDFKQMHDDLNKK